MLSSFALARWQQLQHEALRLPFAQFGRHLALHASSELVSRVELAGPSAPGDERHAQPQGQTIDEADAPCRDTGVERRTRGVLLLTTRPGRRHGGVHQKWFLTAVGRTVVQPCRDALLMAQRGRAARTVAHAARGLCAARPRSGAAVRAVADSRELESGFVSVATGVKRAAEELLPDQAVKTPTKPAVVGIIPWVNRINTLGLLSSYGAHRT